MRTRYASPTQWKIPRSNLGEGPVFDMEARRFYQVNITEGMIYEINIDNGELVATYKVDGVVGAVFLTTDPNLLLAACGTKDKLKLVLIDRRTSRELPEVFASSPQTGQELWNDGKVAPGGEVLFVGTKHLTCSAPRAGFYRYGSDRQLQQLLEGVTVSNGLEWDPTGKWLYYIDSALGSVIRTPFSVETMMPEGFTIDRGITELGLEAIYKVDMDPLELCDCAVPDGMCRDQEGNLYVAIYGGGCVLKLSPEGEPLLKYQLSGAAKPTSVCFGSARYQTLIITTAIDVAEGKQGDFLAKWPDSGLTHTIDVDVPGVPVEHLKI